MNTINTKIEWTIREIKKMQMNFSGNNKIDLTSKFSIRKNTLQIYCKILGNRFCSSDYPKVAWYLCIEIVPGQSSYGRNLREHGFIYVWLRQIGPNGLDDLVNTKYKISAVLEDTRFEIAK
jgi:hypothetical protein